MSKNRPRLTALITAALLIIAANLALSVTGSAAKPRPSDPTPAEAPRQVVIDEPEDATIFRAKTPKSPLPAATARARTAAEPVVCVGDGVSGQRVEVLYVRERSTASRFAEYAPTFRTWSHELDEVYDNSAAQTGGSLRVRFVTEPTDDGCEVTVTEAVVPDGSLIDFNRSIDALKALGYDSDERKYVMFTDANVYCGIGTMWSDDSPGPENRNNRASGYGRTDAQCWNSFTISHELGHNLGAVQASAPNSDNGHCDDEYDMMCYGANMRYVCPDQADDWILDCHHDDYLHTDPPAGSYLATHWNIARSDWLIDGTEAAAQLASGAARDR